MKKQTVSTNWLVARHKTGRLQGMRDLICLVCGCNTLASTESGLNLLADQTGHLSKEPCT